MFSRLSKILGPLIAITLFGAALVVLHYELRDYRWSQILEGIKAIPFVRLQIAIGLTCASYLLLTGYDVLAIRYVGRKLTYPRLALASFVGYTLSHNLGFSVLTGGAARLRLFSRWGLTPIEISQAIAFSGFVFWLGFFALGGIVLMLFPPELPSQLATLPISLSWLGIIELLIVFSALYFWCWKKHVLRVNEWEFPPPPLALTLTALAVSAMDWSLAAGVAYEILPASDIKFVQFLGLFQLSQILGLLSHVPGGVGVFETAVILFYGAKVPHSALISALIVYRLIYYILPLCLSLFLSVVYEIAHHHERLLDVVGKIRTQTNFWVPRLLTGATFLAGVMLLFSSATPAIQERMSLVRELVPLSLIELSHFAGSLAGVGLIILSRGLYRRIDAAYVFTTLLLIIGIVVSLIKGFDFEEASVLLVITLFFVPSRHYFYRKARLFSEPFSNEWMTSIILVLIAMSWLMFFRYKHVEYSHNLWWQFSFRSDAPRSLRATVGAFAAAAAYGVRLLMSPHYQVSPAATAEQLEQITPIIRKAARSGAALVYLGDKSVLVSESGNSFLMFALSGRTWIALGDPVGDQTEAGDLIWRFRELSDQQGALCAFYQVGIENLPYYIETDLELFKLGEEAIVLLDQFSLDGKTKSSLRHSRNRVMKEGWGMRIVPATEVPAILLVLREVSDEWLGDKRAREKSFSLGSFSESYLQRFPVAVVERNGEICAFANLWPGNGLDELSVDLMRQREMAPHGVMDFLFVELMLWGKEAGYKRFNLGMAPFSGFEPRELAPLWTKLGTIIYQRGEKYYNFQGLRQYKEKFDPVWEPRFLAAPGGFQLARTLINIATLISGGVRGMVSK